MFAGDDVKTSAACTVPKTEKRPLEETVHGVKIVDNYRWLEDGSSPETQKWVAEEMAYTGRVLDPLPGREAIHKRLTELLSIGSISAPQIGGNIISTPAAKACRTSPCFMCAKAKAMSQTRKRSRAAGRESTRRRRHHRARLVPAFGEWKVSSLWHVAERLGDEHAAHH